MTARITFPQPARRYPGRHEVVDAVYESEGDPVPVVVKKVPVTGRQRRAGRTKAERSLATARRLIALGVPTPEPLAAEVQGEESWYVCRRLPEAVQIREWFLARDDSSRPAPALPASFEEVLSAAAGVARKLHDGGVFFRDFTDGNLLVTREEGGVRVWLVDLDRARAGTRPLGLFRRLRDLSRLGLNTREDRDLLLGAYYGTESPPPGTGLLLSAMRHRIRAWDALKGALRPWRRSRERA